MLKGFNVECIDGLIIPQLSPKKNRPQGLVLEEIMSCMFHVHITPICFS